MHPADIQAEVKKRGTNMTQLAISWGLSESAIRCALIRPSPRVDPLIARFLNKPLHVVFPDRYDHENIRIYPVSNKNKSKAKKQQSHCKKSQQEFTTGEQTHA